MPARPLFVTPGGKALFAQVDSAMADYEALLSQLMQMAQAADTPEAKQAAIEFAFGPFSAKANAFEDKLGELVLQKEGAAAASAAAAGDVYASTRNLMIALAIGAMAASIGLGLWITRGLTRQLGGEPAYAAQVAAAIAGGELSTAVAIAPGDRSSLLFAMETMRASLVKIVLAQRSAAAAKEIKALIDDSVGKVEDGGRLVGEAGTTMAEVVASIGQVTDIMSEIAAASREQSAGIEQVNSSITQMDEVTQQNAALVEEAAAAAGSLQEQAASLAAVVSVFKLDEAAAPRATAAASRMKLVPPATRATTIAAPAAKRLAVANGSDEWEQF